MIVLLLIIFSVLERFLFQSCMTGGQPNQAPMDLLPDT